MNKRLEKILKSDPRYSKFTYLNKPVPLDKLLKRRKCVPVVQVHDTSVFDYEQDGVKKYGIVGFAGQFAWVNGSIVSLDGDSYNPQMPVLGYKRFKCNGKYCLDVLVVGDKW